MMTTMKYVYAYIHDQILVFRIYCVLVQVYTGIYVTNNKIWITMCDLKNIFIYCCTPEYMIFDIFYIFIVI